jgi:hypothetical protein
MGELLQKVEEGNTADLTFPSSNMSFTLKLPVRCDEGAKEDPFLVSFRCFVPNRYPKVLPQISIHSDSLSKQSLKLLLLHFRTFLESKQGEQTIIASVQWIQENAPSFFKENFPILGKKIKEKENEVFLREFIYFHHVYDKMKRRMIIEWATELDLTGFLLAGKPGIVCVEGEESNVLEYIQRLRNLSWKNMSSRLRHREAQLTAGIAPYRRFQKFEEIIQTMTEFAGILSLHGLSEVFKDLFGV